MPSSVAWFVLACSIGTFYFTVDKSTFAASLWPLQSFVTFSIGVGK